MIGTPIDIGFISSTGRPIQETYLNNNVAWVDESTALAGIDIGLRHPFMPLVIGSTLYWFLADKTTLEPITIASLQAAIDVLITDTAGIYDAANVEDALAEVMAYAISLDLDISALPIPATEKMITLQAGADLATKIANSTETTDYPTGWVLAPVDTVNLSITHNLNMNLNAISIKSVSGTVKTLLRPWSSAWSDIIEESPNVLKIYGIDPTSTATEINLTFK